MSDGVVRLTAIEIATLRHVLDHRTAKEIARIEGVSEDAIVNRINRARAKLGGVTRIAAARIVAEHFGEVPAVQAVTSPLAASHQMVSQPMGVSEVQPFAQVDGAPPLSDGLVGTRHIGAGIRWPFPTRERPTNDDPVAARIAWPIGLAFLTVLALVMLNTVLVSLNNLRL
jgi:DNA-binding CsgD family transcriptional regulator